MKNILFSAALAFAATMSMGTAATITVGTNASPYALGDRNTAFDQNVESESSGVTRAGSHTNYNVDNGATPWGSGTWLFSGYVEVAFTAIADTLFVQFQADTNDGIADFLVDGAYVGRVNTYNRGWFQVEIGDLSLAAHTLRVNLVTRDLAFDNFMAHNNSVAAVPVPAGGLLLLTALGGFAALRKRLL